MIDEKEIIHPICQDWLNKMTYKAIAEKYIINQKTAKRYAKNNFPMSALEKGVYPSILDKYKPQTN